MPGHRVIFRVHVKGIVPLVLRVLCNLLDPCSHLMNYNMTVSLYLDMRGKGEFQGNVVAEDPSDIRVTLDCYGDKRGSVTISLPYKSGRQ